MGKVLEILLSKKVLGPILSILIAYIIYRILKSIINKIFSFKGKHVDLKKKKMINDLINSIIKYFIIIIVSLIILDIFEIDTKALITSLGVLGLVAGLAIQDTLKDFVAGITIIIEDQYRIGDIVSINNFKGEVILLGMKTTRIKSYTGEIMIIPNHLIAEVINYSRSKSLSIVDVSISYESDVDKAIEVLKNMCQDISEKMPELVRELQVLGVQNLSDSSVDIRIVGKANHMEHFVVEREIRKQAKQVLNDNHIEIPYPQVVIHNAK